MAERRPIDKVMEDIDWMATIEAHAWDIIRAADCENSLEDDEAAEVRLLQSAEKDDELLVFLIHEGARRVVEVFRESDDPKPDTVN